LTEQEIIHVMSQQGMRITEQRKTLARLFTEEDKSYSPKDVYDYMEQHYPGLSFDTVYRNLRMLHDLGVLEQFMLEEGVKFKLNCAADQHHHHLICLDCEKTISFDYCPMPEIPNLPEPFRIVTHKFELYGYCQTCDTSSNSEQ